MDRDSFAKERERLNKLVLGSGHLATKRFFNLDSAAYRDGALPGKTKELLGLVASLVLRCDDCIRYHLIRCVDLDYSADEIKDALNVGLIVGGSITIPHLRRAYDLMESLFAEKG